MNKLIKQPEIWTSRFWIELLRHDRAGYEKSKQSWNKIVWKQHQYQRHLTPEVHMVAAEVLNEQRERTI